MLVFSQPLLEKAAFVHCTATAESEQSLPHLPGRTVRVIPNLLDLKSFQYAQTNDA
jgi:hypothetical protein